MDTVFLIIGTAIYTLIGVRIARVAQRARLGGFTAFLLGLTWPTFVPVFGFILMMTGNADIYRNYPPEPPQ